MSPSEQSGAEQPGAEQPSDVPAAGDGRQNLLEQIGFRIHVTFPDLLAIDPDEREA